MMGGQGYDANVVLFLNLVWRMRPCCWFHGSSGSCFGNFPFIIFSPCGQRLGSHLDVQKRGKWSDKVFTVVLRMQTTFFHISVHSLIFYLYFYFYFLYWCKCLNGYPSGHGSKGLNLKKLLLVIFLMISKSADCNVCQCMVVKIEGPGSGLGRTWTILCPMTYRACPLDA